MTNHSSIKLYSVAFKNFDYAPKKFITKKHLLACAFNTFRPISTALRLDTDESEERDFSASLNSSIVP